MDEKEFDYMNVIPLVDVMLVLLTIVLTTSTFIATGAIPVNLPQTEKSTEKVSADDFTLIEINREGEVFFSSDKTDLDDLKNQIQKLSKETPLLIRADKEIALQVFVKVLEIIKQEGFHNVSLQTEEAI